jgi:ribosomal subunit interface protein
MKIPLQITARTIELTDAIKADIEEKAEKLDRFYDQLMRCRVVVESPHRHHHQGNLYEIHIYMTMPGSEIVVKREPNDDLYVAIRDGFNAAYRQLEDFVRRQRRDVKHHEEAPHGRISSLFPYEGYGFLTTPDGREIYFHKNSVINRDFDALDIGMEVRFAEESGEKGPQASTVHVIA